MVAVLLLVTIAANGAGAPSFEDGNDEFVVNLAGPNYEATVNLVSPADYYVTNATMQVTGMTASGNISAYPENVSVMLDSSAIWKFQGPGFGSLGMQDRFSTGQKENKFSFGSGGGAKNSSIRLPKEADVESATVDIGGFPPAGGLLANLSGIGGDDMFGWSVSGAGDLNNDGHDDVIIGSNNNIGHAHAGSAFIYLGSPNPDNNSDITLTGQSAGDGFGYDVSSAGDVNDDGYDDVIVGAYCSDVLQGRAYVFFGGKNMDNNPDVVLSGGPHRDYFGISVSGAGDVNGDGYGDVIVGADFNDSGIENNGRAYVFFGGKNMDNVADVVLTGEVVQYDNFGGRVAGAGDVNNDGYDDVLVTALQEGSECYHFGRVYLFLGGQNMDDHADAVFHGNVRDDCFGFSISGAGDVNDDGYDDIVAGAFGNDTACDAAGQAYLFFGSRNMDNITDVTFTGSVQGDFLGISVSKAGDMNNDGIDDLIVGSGGSEKVQVFLGGKDMDNAPDFNYYGTDGERYARDSSGAGDVDNDGIDDIVVGAPEGHSRSGRAYIYGYYDTSVKGVLDPGFKVGAQTAWNMTGFLNGTVTSDDLAGELNAYLRASAANGKDSYGNYYVDIPINLTARNGGSLVLSNLKISYTYDAMVPDFATLFNNYTFSHKAEKDTSGNLNIPLKIIAQSAGRIKLSGLDFGANSPPTLMENIKDLEMNEDTHNPTLIDLYKYFEDNSGPATTLNFAVVSATNSSYVNLTISSKRYLSADAQTGETNDNWTGTVEVKVACYDRWGYRTESNQFTILVRNVNDPPIITSLPVFFAEPGVPYSYNITAVDGDNDVLEYGFKKAPVNMTIDSDAGRVKWTPFAKGLYEVGIVVNDGNDTVVQEYAVMVPNRPPVITSTPPLHAFVGIRYIYNMTAEDANMDALHFEVGAGPQDMEVDSGSGQVAWIPVSEGDFDVVLRVSDAKERALQEFTINVVRGNRAPEFKSKPITTAMVDVVYRYSAVATDLDDDGLGYSIDSGPDRMTIDATRGKVVWTPASVGNFTIVLKVSDGRGGEAKQEFVIKVTEAVRPLVTLVTPEAGKVLKGSVGFSGIVIKGTHEVILVQMRIDGNEWKDAIGNYSWGYTLDTRSLNNGKHAFEFRAYDGKEYSEIVKVEFKVDNTGGSGKGFIPMFDGTLTMVLVAAIGLMVWARRRLSSWKGG